MTSFFDLINMDSLLLQVNGRFFPSPPQLQPYYLDARPPPFAQSSGFNLENKVSPSILLIIIILAIVFFVSGLLHLLVRFLWTPPLQRDPESSDNVTAFQGQLQQLFHLHDSGVDQSFIDTLPVFHYKAIIGSKSPFDCAVCLCEFEPEDKLRLLPKCSHAFHTECIDTWLLSHSTCPLCRSSLLPDHFSPHTSCAPIVLVLESGSESSRDNVSNTEATNPITGSNSQVGLGGDSEFDAGSSEIGKLEDSKATVVTVKLGKYKNIDAGEGGSSGNKNMDSRRCFSMGSFEYVMEENSSLKVAIRSTPAKKQPSRKPALPLTPGYRAAMSECDCESRREFRFSGIEPLREVKRGENTDRNCKKIDSFSVSKIWLRGKNRRETPTESSRRAVSFRFPIQKNGGDWNASEIGVSRWENEIIRSETELDEENQSRCSFDSQFNQSFAKRTLLWLMGKQSKVTHFESSSPSSCISNL